jgi:hypothetical protein
MSARGFGFRSQSGTAQPLFGTTLSAAANPTPDPTTSSLTQGRDSTVTLSVVDASWFNTGDRVGIGTAANFARNPTTYADYGRVYGQPNYASNTIQVQGLTRAHASGEFVVLGLRFALLNISTGTSAGGTNAGFMYIGTDSSVAAASKTLWLLLGLQGNYSEGSSASGDVFDSMNLWTLGTSADTYLLSIVTI